jgi:hypothetical protein
MEGLKRQEYNRLVKRYDDEAIKARLSLLEEDEQYRRYFDLALNSVGLVWEDVPRFVFTEKEGEIIAAHLSTYHMSIDAGDDDGAQIALRELAVYLKDNATAA